MFALHGQVTTHTIGIAASAAEWFSSNFQVFFSCHDDFLVGECAEIRNRDSVLPDKVGCCDMKVV